MRRRFIVRPLAEADLENAAQWYGEERARLVRLGRTPPFVDGQIAAIAHVHGLEIVTVNLEDFGDFEGVGAVDWRS